MPLDPLDPRSFSLSPEQRTADKFAVLDRRMGTAERGTLRAGEMLRGGAARTSGSGGQTLTTGVLTTIAWSAWVTEGGPNITFNSTQLIVLVGGVWAVSANIEFASNATGYRRMEVARNGAARRIIQACTPAASGATTALSGSQIIHCEAGDYFEVYCQQSSGGNLDVLSIPGAGINDDDPFQLSVVRLGA